MVDKQLSRRLIIADRTDSSSGGDKEQRRNQRRKPERSSTILPCLRVPGWLEQPERTKAGCCPVAARKMTARASLTCKEIVRSRSPVVTKSNVDRDSNSK